MTNKLEDCSPFGGAVIAVDRNLLRIQFSSKISQELWQQKQHYLYLSLSDSAPNRLIAEQILNILQQDIEQNQVDITGRKYRTKVKELIPKISLIGMGLSNKPLTSLYWQYKTYKKSLIEATTYAATYNGVYLKAIYQCPQQDIDKGLEVRQYFLDTYSLGKTKRILGILSNMVEWAKDNRLLPADFINSYRRYAQEIKAKKEEIYPQQIQALMDTGLWEPAHHLVKGFTKEEANAIIQAFDERQSKNFRADSSWNAVVRFLFWTGCRHGECAALRWKHISSDFRFITFERSYDRLTKIEKGTKTSIKRIFPCGPKLQAFFQEIKPADAKPLDLVFSNRYGDYINFGTLNLYWVGKGIKNKGGYPRRYFPGILPQLIEKGVVGNYQNPYATRHTYINIQLEAGIKPKDVAVLVGNSASAIARHYESISREPIQPIEF